MKVYLHKAATGMKPFYPCMAINFSRSARLDIWGEDYIKSWLLVTDLKPSRAENERFIYRDIH